MKTEEIEFLADLVRSRAGQAIDRDKTYLMESRLAPVARREGYGSIRELLQALRRRHDERLAWTAVEAMCVGETHFFRDREVFAQFRDDMLPALARMHDDRPLRILSAGCCTGQEAYSLAMIVDEAMPKFPGLRVEILGVDLSERALEKAQAGLYTQFEVQRGLPIRKLIDHFVRTDDMWAASPRLRAAVRWRRLNLNADISMIGGFDAIFCRNVLGTMDEACRARALGQFAAALPHEGYLIVGADEGGLIAASPFRRVSDGVYSPDPAVRVAA